MLVMADSSAAASGRAAASELNSSSAPQRWPASERSRNSALFTRQRSPATTWAGHAQHRAASGPLRGPEQCVPPYTDVAEPGSHALNPRTLKS